MIEGRLSISRMMTHRWSPALIRGPAAVLLAMALTLANVVAATPDSEAAVRLADDYIAALQAGDVDAIKALMSASYLERRRRQLESDGYSQRLASLYGSSQHQVLRTQSLGDQGATVDVALQASDGEEYTWRLLLERVGVDQTGAPIYRIVGDEEPSD